jgi:hypothetical protein
MVTKKKHRGASFFMPKHHRRHDVWAALGLLCMTDTLYSSNNLR